MSNFKNKYIKYKSKYLQLKKQFGAGIDATYEEDDEDANKITISYFDEEKLKQIIINFTKIEKIGEGTFGIVYKIIKDDDGNEYILKIGKIEDNVSREGIEADLLKNIIDDDMLILFQGRIHEDFLISKYNGKNLFDEYRYKFDKIIDEFNSTTTQLLLLLYNINKNKLFHNDIKIKNITIKNKKVYLIDFGLLDNLSVEGSLTSTSLMGIINSFIRNNYYSIISSEQLITFKKKLKNTDIFGFFYICIDLLILLTFGSVDILLLLFRKEITIINLFYLYYFILPTRYRDIEKVNEESSKLFSTVLPDVKKTREIFKDFEEEYTNLFRFMTFIYMNINIPQINQDNLINFLKILSDCLLPTFEYIDFIPKFNKAVDLLFPKKLEGSNIICHSNEPLMAFISADNKNIIIWRILPDNSLIILAIIPFDKFYYDSIAFHPKLPIIVSSSNNINFWSISSENSMVTHINNLGERLGTFHLNLPLFATKVLNNVKIWSITDDKMSLLEIKEFEEFEEENIYFFVFHPLLPLIAINSNDDILLYNIYDKTSIILKSYKNTVNSIVFHPIIPFFATVYSDKSFKLWYFQDDGKIICIATILEPFKVKSVAFHPTKPLLVSGLNDGTVNLWLVSVNLLSITHIAHIFKYEEPIESVIFQPNSPLLITNTYNKNINLLNIQENIDKSEEFLLRIREKEFLFIINSIEFKEKIKTLTFHQTKDYSIIATIIQKTLVLSYFSPNYSQVINKKIIEGHQNNIISISFHTTLPLLATCDNSNTIKLWNILSDDSQSKLTSIDIQQHYEINIVVFHPTKPYLALSSNGYLSIYSIKPDLQNVEYIYGGRQSINFNFITFHPILDFIIIRDNISDTIIILKFTKDDEVEEYFRLKLEKVCVLEGDIASFHPLKPIIAIKTKSNDIELYQFDPQLEKIGVLKKHDNIINSFAFHPNGNIILSSTKDGTIRLWNLTDSKLEKPCISTSKVYTFSRNPVIFSLNCSFLATLVNDDNKVLIYKNMADL